jgi:hypothetical protein
MTALARAAAHDLLAGKNSTICVVGGRMCGKSSMMFGHEVSRCVSSEQYEVTSERSESRHGLLGQILDVIGKYNHQQQSPCFLSVVEVVDEDIFRDVFGFAYHELNEHDGHPLKLRHVDQRGAVLENLHKIPITDDREAKLEILDAFNNERLKKIWAKEGGHGHFIATIAIEGGGTIQLVDCASADRLCIPSSKSDARLWKQKHDRRMNSIRKSLSSLRGVFRALVVAQDMNDTLTTNNVSPTVSFRECTLTQLLQRCLYSKDGEEKPRAVVMGAVSPSAKDYSQTLSTMDYSTRLLTRQGNTASDPFRDKLTGDKKTYDRDSFKHSALASVLPDDEHFDQDHSFRSFHSLTQRTPSIKSRPSTAGSQSASKVHTDGTILKSIVSDPRQRLAKLLSTASLVKKSKKEDDNDINYGIDTPSSIASEDLQAEFQRKYDNVFDQLDTLMSADEDDIDKRSYGNSLIEALSERKPSKEGNGSSNDLSAKELFSPELNSWSNEMARPSPMMQTANANRGDHFGTQRLSRLGSNGYSPAGPNQNIPSFVVCDDESCRDTVISERGTEFCNQPESNTTSMYEASLTNNVEVGESFLHDKESVNSDEQIKALQSQLEEVMAGNDTPLFAAPKEDDNGLSTDDAFDLPPITNGSLGMDSESDVVSTESENRMIQALQSQMEQAMIDGDFSRCSSAIPEEKEEDILTSKQDIFVQSGSSKLLPLNMLLSNDSVDSEPLLSCRSHASQIYGSLHASHNAPDNLEQIPNRECNENCAFFKKDDDDLSNKSDPMDLNDMMANFEREINTLMQSEEISPAAGKLSNRTIERGSEVTSFKGGITRDGALESTLTNTSAKESEESGHIEEKVAVPSLDVISSVDSGTQTELNGEELASLKNRIQSMSESIAASESFIQRVDHIVRGDNSEPIDTTNLASSLQLVALGDSIKQNFALAEQLKGDLIDSESKLEAAHRATQETKFELEEEKARSSEEMGTFTSFVHEIDCLFPTSNHAAAGVVSVEGLRKVCINRIKDLQVEFQSTLKRNQDCQTEIDSLRNTIADKDSECTELKTLFESAQQKNEELPGLRNRISELQIAVQDLSSKNSELSSEIDKTLCELDQAKNGIAYRDAELSKQRVLIQSSEQKLKSFGVKTAEIMKTRVEEVKARYSSKVASLNNMLSSQSSRIAELEEELRCNVGSSGIQAELNALKSELAISRAANANLEQKIGHAEKASELKLHSVSEKLVQSQNDLRNANEAASKQESENKSLKSELAHLRDVMSIAEESIGELQRLRQENDHLKRQLSNQRGHGALSTSFESREIRSVNSTGFEDERFVHERISALMRENEQSNISMRTLKKENAALRDSIGECHNQMSIMRREMKDLRILSTARKSSPTISEESEMTYTASSLKTPLEYRHSRKPEYYFPVASSTLQTEDTSYSAGQLVAQLSAEKELRYKAEEICAGVLAKTQAGYEKRDAEIKALRAKLFKLSSAKY